MRNTRTVAALAVALAFVAASCGDDSGSTATTAAPETTAAASTTAAAVDTTTPAPETTTGAVDYQWTPNADIKAKAEGQVNQIGRAHV